MKDIEKVNDIKDSSHKHVLLFVSMLVLVASLIYLPIKDYEFINFDDDFYITQNIHVLTGLNRVNLSWAFSFKDKDYWHPLTWMSHMLDVQLFGVNPGKHHLMNLFFHLINSVLVFSVLRKMTGSLWKSAIVASMFALHPINVDSVAWAAERKNLLSTTFWFVIINLYLFYIRKPTLTRYALVLVTFIMGLMAKPMLVTLPFVMLLLEFWPLGRIRIDFDGPKRSKSIARSLMSVVKSRIFLDKIPMILIGLATILISTQALSRSELIISSRQIPMGMRLSNAFVSYLTYIRKLVLPYDLSVYYPFPSSIPLYEIFFAFLAVILVTIAVLAFHRSRPYLLVGWFWFTGTLVPVSGLYQAGLWPALADRWAYVPAIGIFIMASWGIPDLWERLQLKKTYLAVPAGMCICILAATTFVQARLWRNSETLFTRALEVTPNNTIAHNNLALALIDRGDFKQAELHARESIRINPSFSKAYITLSIALFSHGDGDGAISSLQQALRLSPRDTWALVNLGKIMFVQNKFDEALKLFQGCLRINPEHEEAYKFIGNIMLACSRYDEALSNYGNSIRINPKQPEVYYQMGKAYLLLQNYTQAVECFKRGIDDKKFGAQSQENLIKAQAALDELNRQVAALRQSVETDPKDPLARLKLAEAYRLLHNYDGALAQYGEVLALMPRHVPALYGRTLVYAAMKEYSRAIDDLQTIREQQPTNPLASYNIACIYAKQNMKDESISWLKDALDKGFSNWDQIKHDPDLACIRDSSFVKELLKGH